MKIRYFSWLKEITKIECEECDIKNIKDIVKLKKFLVNKYPKLKDHFKKDIIRIAVKVSLSRRNL